MLLLRHTRHAEYSEKARQDFQRIFPPSLMPAIAFPLYLARNASLNLNIVYGFIY